MLESLPASEVAPDKAELDALTGLLDKWLLLTGTVDSDIARYPIWRHTQELIEDLEPSNPRFWNRRIQPLLPRGMSSPKGGSNREQWVRKDPAAR